MNGEQIVPKDVDASVQYVIALWPVSDPFYRYNYAKKTGREKLVGAHIGYFGDEAKMKDASIPRILNDGEAENVPPILIVQPGNDKNVPVEMTKNLIAANESQNGYIEYSFYAQQNHAFGHFPSAETDDCINCMRNYIRRQLQRNI